jgi:glyoxylase-like metal-dependent hydrolase (beta-lactamase superfamily II)
LPKERVLFSASAYVSEQVNIFRPFVNISDILAAGKMMKAFNPEHVIPGHGPPTTTKLFDDGEKYYGLLVERVAEKVNQGKSLDDIKKEVNMPEYANWGSQDRMPTNIEAAYRMVVARLPCIARGCAVTTAMKLRCRPGRRHRPRTGLAAGP